MVSLRDTAGGLWRTPDPQRDPAPDGPDARLISREYLTVMGIAALAGRSRTEQDNESGTHVILVNQTLARREFPNSDPVGQTVYYGRIS